MSDYFYSLEMIVRDTMRGAFLPILWEIADEENQ